MPRRSSGSSRATSRRRTRTSCASSSSACCAGSRRSTPRSPGSAASRCRSSFRACGRSWKSRCISCAISIGSLRMRRSAPRWTRRGRPVAKARRSSSTASCATSSSSRHRRSHRRCPRRGERSGGRGESLRSSLETSRTRPFSSSAGWRVSGTETTRRILAADNAPSRLDLLTNPRRTNREALRSALASEGVETELSPLAPLALTVLKGNPLRSGLLAAGHFSVQDVGAQLLPLLLPEGELLVDLAAAPGGKSLSAIAHGRARWTAAVDRSRRRLERVTENARRLGVPEVRALAGDIGALPLSEGRFERVLLDAPCSGTGTLRKNPEIRYRVTAEAIDRIARSRRKRSSPPRACSLPGGISSTRPAASRRRKTSASSPVRSRACPRSSLPRSTPPPRSPPSWTGPGSASFRTTGATASRPTCCGGFRDPRSAGLVLLRGASGRGSGSRGSGGTFHVVIDPPDRDHASPPAFHLRRHGEVRSVGGDREAPRSPSGRSPASRRSRCRPSFQRASTFVLPPCERSISITRPSV